MQLPAKSLGMSGSRHSQLRGPQSLVLGRNGSVDCPSMDSKGCRAQVAENRGQVANTFCPRFERLCGHKNSLLLESRASTWAHYILLEPILLRDALESRETGANAMHL